jgi:hypothetical protein
MGIAAVKKCTMMDGLEYPPMICEAKCTHGQLKA